jgi:hypothetical protein
MGWRWTCPTAFGWALYRGIKDGFAGKGVILHQVSKGVFRRPPYVKNLT